MSTNAPLPRNWLSLVFFIALAAGGGLLIGTVTRPDGWYAALNKPAFNPPNWVFGPVWTILYVLIGIAGWRVWRHAHQSAAMKFWWAQLVLNFAWSPVFFGLHQPALALAIIAALFGAIVLFMVAARRIDRPAMLLFAPYAAWVAFATLLNGAIVSLN